MSRFGGGGNVSQCIRRGWTILVVYPTDHDNLLSRECRAGLDELVKDTSHSQTLAFLLCVLYTSPLLQLTSISNETLMIQ